MSEIETIWSAPAAPRINGPALSVLPNRTCMLELSFRSAERSEGAILIFEKVEGYKCTFLPALASEARNAAPGALVEIPASSWKAEIVAANRTLDAAFDAPLRHLMIYFEAGPCFEFVCADCEVRVK